MSERFSSDELADRATKIYRLVDDLLFEEACRVLNAVLTAKTRTFCEPKSDNAPLVGNQGQLTIQNREAGPTDCPGSDRPQLNEVPIGVPNKLPIPFDLVELGSRENVNEQSAEREGGNLKVTIGEVTFTRTIY